MSECPRCQTERQTIMVEGRQAQVCMHVGCIMERLMERHEGCNHELETVGDHLRKCTKCGMTATPSY